MNAMNYDQDYGLTPEKILQRNIISLSTLITEDCNASMQAVNHSAHNFN